MYVRRITTLTLADALLELLDDKGNPFPGVFNVTNFTHDNPIFSRLNSTLWTGCQPGQPGTEYLQFPIASMTQGMKYKGGAPGQDRVLALGIPHSATDVQGWRS